MPFETFDSPAPPSLRPTVAIVGSGISGLGAAWKLAPTCDVTVFEAADYIGGHARTLMAGSNRDIPVDTGFMVFNDRTYPKLLELFAELDITSLPAPMYFAVSLDDGAFEYGLTNPGRIFADPRNALRPRFLKLMADILKFNTRARSTANSPDMTLGELLARLRLGDDFSTRYLYPLAGAIWSTARDDMHAFPAQTFVRFFENHGLLSPINGPQWRTVKGGSREYVDRLSVRLARQNVKMHTRCAVEAAGRTPRPWIKPVGQPQQAFDHVIFASHSDQTLALLTDASPDEQAILGDMRYRPNEVILHKDTSQMPLRKAAWSSWVYKGASSGAETDGSFTYWMNALQSLPMDQPLFVTLNPRTPIPDDLVYDRETFYHPQFDLSAIRAQEKLPHIQGQQGFWYCGAWTRYGFHEDGLSSGLNVANDLLAQCHATGRVSS